MKAGLNKRPKKAQVKDKGLGAKCWDFRLAAVPNKLGRGLC
jgi:hypothetical protein